MEVDFEVFEIPELPLHKGGHLPCARLAYKTWGTLSRNRDNAILFPTWYAANHRHNAWLVGPGRALDTDRYFIISPNLLGNGLSSSPSNTAAPLDRMRFPLVTVFDNVEFQRRLVAEHFGIQRLALVLGRSMGGQQAFQWASSHPDMVGSVLPIECSARTTPHNHVFLEGVRAALTADSAWAGGDYERQPLAGVRAMGRVYAGWAMSQAFYRSGLHLLEGEGAVSIEEFLRKRWDGNFARCDANDLLSMISTWQANDLADNARHGGDWVAALAAIRATAIVMPCRTDLYFPPEDSEAAVRHMPKAELRVIESVWGHRAGGPGTDPKDIAFIETAIRDLLDATR